MIDMDYVHKNFFCPLQKFILIAFFFFPHLSFAYYGIQFSYALISKEPSSLRGYQFMIHYTPKRLTWKQLTIYFDGGISHFRETKTPYHTTLNLYSIAPVIRYTFKKHAVFKPYLEASIGLAYLNHTYLEHRNLGIHFAFQDRLGIGTFIGHQQQLSVGIHAVHYSNAHLSNHNSGITIPLLLDVGYRFL